MRIEALEANLAGNTAAMNAVPPVTYGAEDSQIAEAIRFGLMAGTAPLNATSANAGPTQLQPVQDLHTVIQQLDLAQNKYFVLRLMSRADWMRIIAMLPKALLINALSLFDKQKLLRMILWLPSSFQIRMLLRVYGIPELVSMMPAHELMRILHSGKLNMRELIKGLRRMSPSFVHLLLSRIYGGQDYDKMKDCDIWQLILRTNKGRLMEALKTLPFKALIPMVTALLKQDPELLLLLSEDFFARLFDKMSKPTLLDACYALPEDLLIKMLSQLPDASLILAAAQIDENTLEGYLLSQQADLLLSLASAA